MINKSNVDTEVAKKLDAIPQADLNMNNNSINLALPSGLEDATTKQYVDESFLRIDGTNIYRSIK